MISLFAAKLCIVPLILCLYQYSKQDNAIVYNILAKNTVLAQWKKHLDEPCLSVVAVYGVPVIVGAASSQTNLEKASALLFKYFDEVENLANTSIGKWNYNLMNKITLQLILRPSISSRNFHIFAIKGHVWVVGVAKNAYEKEEIIKFIKSFPEVKTISHYIKFTPSTDRGFVVRH